LVLLGVLLVSFVLGRPERDLPPLDPRSHQPDGTSALVAMLRALDVEVELSIGLPDERDDVALVLVDRLGVDQHRDLFSWVQRGGRLVVADPYSPLVSAPVGVETAVEVAPGLCTIAALAEVGVIEPGPAVRFPVPAGASSCYGDRHSALVVSQAHGDGRLVGFGATGALTNDALGDSGNAAAAAAVLGPRPGERLRIVDPPVPVGGDETLYELVPDGVRRALVQLGVAFVLYAAWRAIRLGRPVPETDPVPIAGSELVAATGRLLAGTRAPQAAAERLRGDLRSALGQRLGTPADVGHEALIASVLEHLPPTSALAREDLERALLPTPVRSDGELVAVARAAAAVRQELLT
jgi:hypothetical protein